MDFKDQLKQLSERIQMLKDQIQTEEATKTSLIMPFIQTLGYDVFNPMEVRHRHEEGREGGLLYYEGWRAHYPYRVQALGARSEFA